MNWTGCGQYLRSDARVDLINIKYHKLLVNWSIILEQLIFVTALNIYSLNVRKHYSRKLYLFYILLQPNHANFKMARNWTCKFTVMDIDIESVHSTN